MNGAEEASMPDYYRQRTQDFVPGQQFERQEIPSHVFHGTVGRFIIDHQNLNVRKTRAAQGGKTIRE
jgi:hypothetical protein